MGPRLFSRLPGRLRAMNTGGSESEDQVTTVFEITTPMFLGDADRQASRLRPESLKGAWRFWWRATNWGRFLQAEAGNTRDAFVAMQRRELELFGGPASTTATGGQSPIQFLPVTAALEKYGCVADGEHAHFRGDQWDGLRHLGYGAIVTANEKLKNGDPSDKRLLRSGELLRRAFKEGQSFELSFRFSRRLDEPARNELLDALEWAGLLGGLGNRWRRGFGSLSLLEFTSKKPARSFAAAKSFFDYGRQLAEKVLKTELDCDELPLLSAVTSQSSIDMLPSSKTPARLLSWAGERLMLLRSSGYGAQRWVVPGVRSLHLFADDHKAAGDGFNGGARIPLRTVFGCPHAYDKYKRRVVPHGEFSRRASPMLFHVHPLRDASERSALVVTILPAIFAPEQPAIIDCNQQSQTKMDWQERTGQGWNTVAERAFDPDWDVPRSYFDGRLRPPQSDGHDDLEAVSFEHGRITVLGP